ncbi:hypothetical protein GCM10007028_04470 [Algibacter mikhailovii]|uniref:Uncharacterized protein n=1 Tax=Algibacter mikhailovii TaxID=425498 RepID=A0A918QVK8_9FLAO|nr:hypothetical protein GCM10007028_04470 [Algibacter mikhailovii]
MNKVMLMYKGEKLNPYYLQGGGHTLEGGKAYIDAISVFNNEQSLFLIIFFWQLEQNLHKLE